MEELRADDGTAADGGGMRSLLRGLQMLEVISEHQPIGVGELTKMLKLPKSTVQRTLVSLAQAGWLEPAGSERTRWELTQHVWMIGQRARKNTLLRDVAMPLMRELGATTAETIHLAVPGGTQGVVTLDRVDSTQPVRVYNPIGATFPFHSCASGKSILAFWPQQRVDEVLSRPLLKMTDRTTTDPEALRIELDEVRQRGYALNTAENRPGVCAIGCPILERDGYAVASVGISMPQDRYDWRHVPKWGEQLIAAAKKIESAWVSSNAN
ncbi:IclR family transcriptional regulator [Amycolatopsis sp.]|jgi:IclR family acetate operon transcriptional repressor|uniref:IclR family transcriptional regulator n=1 Tax=Amycolatopsis sp. TaxID=37632 RepID=UPI00260697D4|nr:IclR family transcriptional regulator [Amycolatopsis sp.]